MTDDDLKSWVSYNRDTGQFTWLKTSGKGYVGAAAGTMFKGYVMITIRGKHVLAHRLAWFFEYGRWPAHQIDHINGVKDDNRITNLREATNAQNHCNRGPQKNSTSGVKGVYWFKPDQRWKAQIVVRGKCMVLGYFRNFDDAVRCRKEAEEKYQGEWRHNESLPVTRYASKQVVEA